MQNMRGCNAHKDRGGKKGYFHFWKKYVGFLMFRGRTVGSTTLHVM